MELESGGRIGLLGAYDLNGTKLRPDANIIERF
jgi:hypothetical protein